MIVLLLLAALTALPDGVTPRKHIIELTIDPSVDTFTGSARIELTLRAPQTKIWVNGRDLTVSEAWVEAGGKRIAASTESADGEFIGVTPASPVGPGDVTVGIRYSAPLSAQAVARPNRKKQGDDWYAFTTFTPTDARRAFPCFDEPRFKTVWEMSMHVRREYVALANAPMISETDEANGRKLVRFAPTQLLPAEVVAFAVGPFDILDGGKAGAGGTPIRVITAKGEAALGKEAVQATQAVLPRLEKYTGIPYPWEKLDHIALPQGAFGAVENPGLITYQSRGLLVPPANPSGVRALETHEIGHQWFGNLVTQADWIDVWLSEGFATWIAAKMTDDDQPADRRRMSAVVSRERIMAMDAGPNTHPVRWPRQGRKELDSVYNRIAYDKGGAVLLMLEAWLGEDKFQAGLRTYLSEHRLGNATTRDLEAALPVEATAVMESILNTTGIPSISASCDGETLIIDRTGPGPLPVCWKHSAGMSCTRTEQPRTMVTGNTCDWIYPNAAGAGYYRVVWTDAQLDTLLSGGLAKLNGAERLTLVYDLRAQRSQHRILKVLAADAQPEIAKAAQELQKN